MLDEFFVCYHSNMTNNDVAIEHFRKNMSRVYKQNPINERDFLFLCKEATDLVNIQWEDREIIASRITTIWFRHFKELSDQAKYIGGLFADLDLPDDHIVSKNITVRKLWNELNYIVMYAIHEMEIKS